MILINVHNALRRQKLEKANQIYQQDLEQKVEERTTKLKEALNGIIQAMGRTIEFRDPYTAGHQMRVASLTVAIAKEMGLPKDHLDWIRVAAKIHDLGKISVPAEILSKPGKLNENEYAIIRTHPNIGYDIIAGIEFPWPIAQVILQHHERINGSGYPQGLSGEDILLEARILSVADVVEAMASHRPYRPTLGIEKALNEISENKGVLYDSNVARALSQISTSEIEEILG
jgi:HD-GYP domain-containing protein (c-di-GMP phosphodiesterase class II)